MRNNSKIRDAVMNDLDDDGVDDGGKRSMLGIALASVMFIVVTVAMMTTCSGAMP